MNSTVQAALDAELATLTPVQDAPSGVLSYGSDLSCITDLDPALAEVNPESPVAVVEAVIRRFITPRSTLIDDPDYGQDVRAHCNRGVTQRDLRALAGALQGEAQKDDRVAKAEVKLTADNRAHTLAIEVKLIPVEPALHDFGFTFSVTSGDVLGVTING